MQPRHHALRDRDRRARRARGAPGRRGRTVRRPAHRSRALKRAGARPASSPASSADYPAGAGLGGSSAVRRRARRRARRCCRARHWPPNELAALQSRDGGRGARHRGRLSGPLTPRHTEARCCSASASVRASRRYRAACTERRRSRSAEHAAVYTGESRLSGSPSPRFVTRTSPASAHRRRARSHRSRWPGRWPPRCAPATSMRWAALVGEHWVHQRALHPTITTPRIDAIVERAARAGALGLKALGASGGGCVLAIAGMAAKTSCRRRSCRLASV